MRDLDRDERVAERDNERRAKRYKEKEREGGERDKKKGNECET